MKLVVLDIIRQTDLKSVDSIVGASSKIHAALCDFTGRDSRLIEVPDVSYQHLTGINSETYDRQYDVTYSLEFLQNKFENDIKDLLWYCARIGVEIV